jgi:hypothetical protein
MKIIRVSIAVVFMTIMLLFCGVRVVRAADTASITDKSDDGSYLALDDGTKWIVEPSDRSTASTWTVGDDVVYIDDSKNCTNVEIINTDEGGDEVCAKQISN